MTPRLVPVPHPDVQQAVHLFRLAPASWSLAIGEAERIAMRLGVRCAPAFSREGALTFDLSGPDAAVEAVGAALVAWAERHRR